MVNIWKIGAWPGLWGKEPTEREDRVRREQKFINEYALPNDFVALGSAYVSKDMLLAKNELRSVIKLGYREENNKEINSGQLNSREKMLTEFANINDGEIVLLYFIGETPHNGKVYVGEAKEEKNPYNYTHRVKTPYYYVEKKSKENIIKDTIGIHIAPHRIGVKWLFDKKPFPADFSGIPYLLRIYQVLEKDLEKKIKDKELRKFLERKMRE